MLHGRGTRSPKSAFLSLLLVCGGCATSASVEHPAPDYVPAEVQLGSERPAVSESQIDSLDRHLSTVRVRTTFLIPEQGAQIKRCSGVLIHPKLVLTAGHCVCRERKPVPPEASDTTLIDRSTCAKTTAVTLVDYRSPGTAPENASDLPFDELGPYRGTVQPHEDLRIIYRPIETSAGWETTTEYSNADLAVIVLDHSLQGLVEPVKLAERPVQLKERVIMVGYGAMFLGQETVKPERRYGENEVASIKEDGSTFHVGTQLEISPVYSSEKPGVLRKRGSYVSSGDSGGPCLRERKGALELVGIARSTHGPPIVLSVYTSTHVYLGWLRQKLASVESSHTD